MNNSLKFKSFGKNVIIGNNVSFRNPELVSIGNNVIIDDFTSISGTVSIGNFVHIGSNCTLQASSQGIVIKDFSGISAGTRVFAVSSNYIGDQIDLPTFKKELIDNKKIIKGEVIIQKYVLIGSNCILMPGVKIPIGSTFQAGAIIRNKKYENWYFYGGPKLTPLFKRNKEQILIHHKKIMKFYEDN